MEPTKLESMREAGSVLREAFSLIFFLLSPGKNLEELDLEVGRFLAGRRAISGLRLLGFPFNMCVSIDYEVIQGYPNRVLTDTDIVSIDMSILCKGVYVDKARTITMPNATPIKQELEQLANNLVGNVVPHLKAGLMVGEVGGLVQKFLEPKPKFRACRYLNGHGIGDHIHEEPLIPNYDNGSQVKLVEGQFITLEPIVYGYPMRKLFFDDKWTITSDELSAHAEDTIYIKKDGAEVLT
jgi:methionyl aminopeptidase